MYPVFDKSNYSIRWKMRYVFRDLLNVPVQFARDIKRCYQRMHKGYCDSDLWNIDEWFLSVMPDMLQELKEISIAYPVELCVREDCDCTQCDRECHREWGKILDRMTYLLKEAKEPSVKNPYEDEVDKIEEAFWDKYGVFGDKLDREEEKKTGHSRMYTPCDLLEEYPDYPELHDKYMKEWKKIEDYKTQCKDEALDMFKKWFWGLGD